jgi:hypothetical protein
MAEPTEGITPAQKPAAVPVTQQWRDSRQCCCGKAECKEIKDLIDQNAPDDHVWKGDYIVVNITGSAKATALWASVVHHLKAPTNMQKYRVARHHWSQAVLSSTHKTLISREYFDFGTFLMTVIVESLTQAHIANEGNNAWKNGMARVDAEFETIKRRFLALGEHCEKLDTSAKISVLKRLVRKAAHARHGVEWKIYKEQTVKRKGKSYVGSAHRENLKNISKGSETSSLPKAVFEKRDNK